MPNQLLSVLTLPVDVNGEIQNITYDIKDSWAREKINNLGSGCLLDGSYIHGIIRW